MISPISERGFGRGRRHILKSSTFLVTISGDSLICLRAGQWTSRWLIHRSLLLGMRGSLFHEIGALVLSAQTGKFKRLTE